VAQTTWQAAVLAIVILLAQGLLRNRLSPAWRYGLWLLLVGRLLMPAMPPSAVSIFNLAPPPSKHVFAVFSPPIRIGSDPQSGVNYFNGTPKMPLPNVAEQHEDTILQTPPGVIVRPVPISKIEWPNILFWAWLSGVCFFGARLVWSNARFRSRLEGRQPVADENVTRLFNECRTAFNITRPVRLIESEEVESPAVYGTWRKWLLLPDGIFERFSTEELRCIFLHELAHIKRGDPGINWVVALLQVLHWFNPVLWLAWARMRADREVATDALALAHVRQTDHVSYGETILKVLEGLTGARALPGSVGIAESKAQLKERLLAISRPGKTWKWAAPAAFVLIAGLGLTREQTEKTPRDHSSARTGSAHVVDSEMKQPAESKLLARDATNVDPLLSKDGSSGPGVMPEISGRIVDPRGQPVSGVQIAVAKPHFNVSAGIVLSQLFDPQVPHLYGEPRLAKAPWDYCTTDAQGRFYLNDLAGASYLVAAHERGFAEIATNQFSTNMMIPLEPWGRIEGTLRRYDKVVSHDWVSLGYTFNTFYNLAKRTHPVSAKNLRTLWYPDWPNMTGGTVFKTETDDAGHYAFDYVRPGQYDIFGSRVRERAAINANETTVRNIGGHGRPVIGEFKIRNPYVQINWESETVNGRWQTFGFSYFCTEPPMPAKPFNTRQEYQTWRKQREVDRSLDNNGHGHEVLVLKDGSFRIEQVEPGKYELELFIYDPRHPVNLDFCETNFIAEYNGYDRTFEIPASDSNTREPLDLGVIEISLKPQEASGALPQTNRPAPVKRVQPPP